MSYCVLTCSDGEEKPPYFQILFQADIVKNGVHIEIEGMDKDSYKTLHALVPLGKSFYTPRKVCAQEIPRYKVKHS